MSDSNITFVGLEDVLERLDGIADDENLQKGLEQACLIVERSARQKATKGTTGDLARYISHKVEADKGRVFNPLEYAPYVEYGTGAFREENPAPQGQYWVYVMDSGSKGSSASSKRYTLQEAQWIVARMQEEGLPAVYTNGQHPKPFMRPALDENRERIKEILREALLSD